MTARTLVARFRALEIPIYKAGDRLHVGIDRELMPADLLAALKTHKPEILGVLAQDGDGERSPDLSRPEAIRALVRLGYHAHFSPPDENGGQTNTWSKLGQLPNIIEGAI